MEPTHKPGRLERIRVRRIRFLCEQDGPSEGDLKKELVALFSRANWVRVAYLAVIAYGENAESENVALCVRGQAGQERIFAERVTQIFGSMFNGREHLDIIWLTPEQETDLASVCQPFFRGAG